MNHKKNFPLRGVVLACSLAMAALVAGCGAGTGASGASVGSGGTVIGNGASMAVFAGSLSVPGDTDATGTAARFTATTALTADQSGNLYVFDEGNFAIRKITPAGVVSTVANSAALKLGDSGGIPFYADLSGLAVDNAGTIYATDRNHGQVLKITPAGAVSTLAGPPDLGTVVQGTGSLATYGQPTGITVDAGGTVYVTATFDGTVRKITADGHVTTLAGNGDPASASSADGSGAAAGFQDPTGIVADGAGNLYVADSTGNTIRKITPAGVVSTIAGKAGVSGNANGSGAAASFNRPIALAIDASNDLYVADSGNAMVRKITPAGVVTTVAGTTGSASFTPGVLPGALATPVGLALYGGTLYITMQNGVVAVSKVP